MLFPVYPLMPIKPKRAVGSWLYTDTEEKYLDLYGGHAVISIGHSHPKFNEALHQQIDEMIFYSNSVQNPLQERLGTELPKASNLDGFQLFMCSSGAEALENALKVASFETKRSKILSMKNSFHGRTSGAVAITDNPKIISPFNACHQVTFTELNDTEAAVKEIEKGDYAAVVVECIQGVGGIYLAEDSFLQELSRICKKTGTKLIMDEVQSGFGRSGKFFAYQYAGIVPDLVTMAKGMGNGFPVGGILIHPDIKAWSGMLGTTFGGSQLACAAVLSVLEVIESEQLIQNSADLEPLIKQSLRQIPEIKEVRGRGLMIGFDFDFPAADLRKNLALEEKILIGSSSQPNTLRLLPALNIKTEELDLFYQALKTQLQKLETVQ